MDRLRSTLLSVVILSVALIWATCCNAAPPPQAPPVRKCLCEGCQCGPECRCTSGVCACPGCSVAAEPVRLVLVTATAGWCPACERMHPAWAKVAAANPDVCEQIDIDASPEFCRSLGIRQVPTLLLMQGDRKVYAWPAGVYARNQIEWMVGKARERR